VITRRNFCVSLAGLVAAPYVIRNSGVLMPVRQRILPIVYAMNTNANTGYYSLGHPPLGAVYPFASKPPKGWVPFTGEVIAQEQHPELFKMAGWEDFPHVQLEMHAGHAAIKAPPSTLWHNAGLKIKERERGRFVKNL